MRGVEDQIIGREDRDFVARDYWIWLIFEGLQTLLRRLRKNATLLRGCRREQFAEFGFSLNCWCLDLMRVE